MEGVVGVKIDSELPHFARIVKVGLMPREILVTIDAVVLQMVVWRAVGQQVVSIVVACFNVVVDVLIEAAEGVVVVYLVVEACASLEVRVALYSPVAVGDAPQRV